MLGLLYSTSLFTTAISAFPRISGRVFYWDVLHWHAPRHLRIPPAPLSMYVMMSYSQCCPAVLSACWGALCHWRLMLPTGIGLRWGCKMSQPIICVSDPICQSASLAREQQHVPGSLARCCGIFGVSELSRKKGEALAFSTSLCFPSMRLNCICRDALCAGNEQVAFILCAQVIGA